jgi:CBS domain-containing protein
MKKRMSLENLRRKKLPALSSFADDEKETRQKIDKRAKDAMIKPVLLCPDDDAEQIIKKLKREDTNACIVVDENGKFLGEIGVEDLVKLFLRQVKYEPLVQMLNIGYNREFQYLPAKKLINKHKSTVKENAPINNVIKLIYKEGFNYIPVLDEDKKVVGVVTPSSLIDFLQNE